ncbi:hypothetical protein WJX75_005896 [Coccomyxa subellipsoidea]|uniref:protein-serine/threonine phosphatase n=1 Tax=Coccomyxa subellipsoidea TaxID=248742 RepID=A0ABR2Z1K7_9CHLO
MGNLSSCLSAGTNEGPHDAVAVHGVEVGVRCCFYWLSDDAERTLSPAERIKWMEESGKGECQDAAITQTDFASSTGSVFAGVFDGHGIGGRQAAAFAAGEITRELANDPRTEPAKIGRQWKAAVTDACVAAHTALSKPQLAGCDARYSGSTACMALVHDGQLFLANVGDSRAMLARLNPLGRIQGIPLTQDNKPDDPEERRRIERTGAIVSPMRNREGAFVGPQRVFGPDGFAPGLAMSRSLGDLLAHSLGVCPLPITSQRRLTSQDQFVVLATDGVWEVMTCQEVAHFVQRWRKRPWAGWSASDALTLEAQERWKLLQPEIMVDDVAAIVIMLTSPPANAAAPRPAPKKAARAQATNSAANSVDAKADRDALSALPYMNFFRHLELDKLDSLNASVRGGSHVRFEDRDEDDAPAPPGAGPKPAGEDGGAALRRALSRNTIVPQQVYDGAPSSPADSRGGASTGNNVTQAADGAPSAATDVPTASAVAAVAPGPAGDSAAEGLRPARSGLPRAPSREDLPATAFPSSIQGHQRSPSRHTALRELKTPPPSALGMCAQRSPSRPPTAHDSSPFAIQKAAWAALDSSAKPSPRALGRAMSSPAVDKLRLAALAIPKNTEPAVGLRALSANSMLRPFSSSNLLRPIRKTYPSEKNMMGSPTEDSAGSPLLGSPMRSEGSETLDGRQHGGGGGSGSGRDPREGRVRGGICRMNSVPEDLHSIVAGRRNPLPSRSKSTRVLSTRAKASNSPWAPLSVPPMQMALPETPAAVLPRPVFANPFANLQVQGESLNPWDESSADSSRHLTEGGATRGSSAALDMLRASPSNNVLAHAYTAPSAAMLPAWSDSPPSAHEGSPLLYPGWADSADGALTAAAASDHSPNSPLPSVSEEEPSVHSMRSGHSGTVADSVGSLHPKSQKTGMAAHQKLALHGVSCPPAAHILVKH